MLLHQFVFYLLSQAFMPLLGYYGPWSKYSECTASCQVNPKIEPTRTRTRQCLGATLNKGCSGPYSETVPCNVAVPCPGLHMHYVLVIITFFFNTKNFK